MKEPQWDRAMCRWYPPELWFAADGARWDEDVKPSEVREMDIARARSLCQICPIREGCLEYAMATKESFGMYGGLTARERYLEHRRRERSGAHSLFEQAV